MIDLPATTDTALAVRTYDIPLQLAIIQNRIDLLVTINLYAFAFACAILVCYIFYSLLKKFII